MEETGKTFTEVLEDAKRLGFAESNPASDLEGNENLPSRFVVVPFVLLKMTFTPIRGSCVFLSVS